MNKVIMIGGNGFLGKHVVNLLDNFELYNPTHKEVDWATGRGMETLPKSLNGYIVIHMLAIYGGLPFCMSNRVRMGIENLEINAKVYRYLSEAKPRRIITVGSGCEYPGYKTGVLKEEDLGNGKLHQSVEHYGYTKLLQLELCKSLREEYNIEYEHIVLSNMYGPGDIFDAKKSHVVGALIYKFVKAIRENKPLHLLGTGRAVRDLIYVEDVAKMIQMLANREKSTNQPLNASTGIGVSIKDLASTIADLLNFKNEILWGNAGQDGSLVKYLSADKTESVLGWKPNTSLRDGLKKTIDWYLKNNDIA